MSTVALIGSPFQLLCLLEACDAGAVEEPPLVFLQGQAPHYQALLAEGSHLVADVVLEGDVSTPRMAQRLRSADVLALGDPYSRLGQAVLAGSRRSHVIFLEDGAASLRAVRSLALGEPQLTRAHDARASSRRLASFAQRRLVADPQRFVLVHSLPHHEDVLAALALRGIRVIRHRFDWTRSTWPVHGEESGRARLVLGSSLAADGLVDDARYSEWLTNTLSSGDVVFRPHRRETAVALRVVAEAGTTTVVRDSLPVEVAVSRQRFSEIATLPSTAALTMPIVAPDATVTCVPVPEAWWRPGVPSAMVELTSEIVALSRRNVEGQ